MLPAPGRYRLTQTNPPVPGGYSCDVRVTPSGLYAGPLFWPYSVSFDLFTLAPGVGVECVGDGTYNASGPNGQVSGTCVRLPE